MKDMLLESCGSLPVVLTFSCLSAEQLKYCI